MENREGRILRDRRTALGLTQQEVAQELGMSIHQYQRYEYGESTVSNSPMRIGQRISRLCARGCSQAVSLLSPWLNSMAAHRPDTFCQV